METHGGESTVIFRCANRWVNQSEAVVDEYDPDRPYKDTEIEFSMMSKQINDVQQIIYNINTSQKLFKRFQNVHYDVINVEGVWGDQRTDTRTQGGHRPSLSYILDADRHVNLVCEQTQIWHF